MKSKRLFLTVLVFLCLFTITPQAMEPIQEAPIFFQNFNIYYQNTPILLKHTTFLFNDQTYVSMEELLKALNFNVEWDETSHRVEIKDKSILSLKDCNPMEGEYFIYGEIKGIDVENQRLYILQHIDDNSREIYDGLQIGTEAIILLQRNNHQWPIAFQDLKIGDVIGLIVEKNHVVRGIIVDG